MVWVPATFVGNKRLFHIVMGVGVGVGMGESSRCGGWEQGRRDRSPHRH